MTLTSVIALAGAWFLVLVRLVLDWTGIRRSDPRFRWWGAGLLVGLSSGLINSVMQLRGWSASQRLPLGSVSLVLALVGCVLLAVGFRRGAEERDGRD
jgi:drug/metabolite transporter (DMT)-like permease